MMDVTMKADMLRLAEPIVPQIVQLLRQAIVEMKIRPGQALSEADIAKHYGISRQPVREAFIKLREIGLVQILPSRGTYVVKISVREVLNARFVREAIEGALARTAAQLIDESGCDALRENIALQREAAAAGDAAQFYKLDEVFHRAVAACSECDYAARLVESVRAQIDRVRFLSLPKATPLDVLLAQHQAIADAIISRKPDEAHVAMCAHLREILISLPQLAKKFPDFFEDADIPAHAAALISNKKA